MFWTFLFHCNEPSLFVLKLRLIVLSFHTFYLFVLSLFVAQYKKMAPITSLFFLSLPF